MSTTYTVPIGPTHPALKEPMMFEFEIDGEKVINVDLKPGWNHRGIELAGQRRNPVKTVYLAERICGICSFSHPFAFCRAVENAGDIDVPDRAHYIRTIIAELERMHSHALWAGVAAHEIGFDTLLHIVWDVREKVMDLLEHITGNRVNYAMLMVGGVRRDITPQGAKKIREALDYYKNLHSKLMDLFLKDPAIAVRTKNVGVLSYNDALHLCAVGPTARASGLAKDVRSDQPYAAYTQVKVTPITPDHLTKEVNGDVYDRVVVRLLELAQSIEIIEKCLEDLPDGPLMSEPVIPKLLAQLAQVEGEGIGRIEAPRGECFHYVLMEKKEAPTTWKAKAPTYSNLLPWKPMLLGAQIADIPIIAASTDPCIACMDRCTLTHGKDSRVATADELRKLSVEKTRRLQKC